MSVLDRYQALASLHTQIRKVTADVTRMHTATVWRMHPEHPGHITDPHDHLGMVVDGLDDARCALDHALDHVTSLLATHTTSATPPANPTEPEPCPFEPDVK